MKMRAKYKVPPNPLEQEALSDKLEPDEKWTDQQVYSLAVRLGKNGNAAEQTAAGMIISQVKQKQWRSEAGRRFLRGFFMFLLGRLPDNVSKHSQFGQQPLYDDPEVRAYLEAFVQARTRFKVQLKKLTMTVPKGINQWYLYYKYIVLGKMLDPPNDPITDGTSIDYLDDWETFERAFDNAQDQEHFWPDHKWWPRPYRDKNGEAFNPYSSTAPDDPPPDQPQPPAHAPRARPARPPPQPPNNPPPTTPLPPAPPDYGQMLADHRAQMEQQNLAHRQAIADLIANQPKPPPPADMAAAYAPFHQAQIDAIQQTHAEQMRQLADYHARLSAQQEQRHQQQVAWIQNNFPPPSDRPPVHSIGAESPQQPPAAAATPQLSEPMRIGSLDVGGPGKGPNQEPPAAAAPVPVGLSSFSSAPRVQQNVPVPLQPEPVQQLTGGIGGPRPDSGSGPVLASTAESIAARATAEERQRQEVARQQYDAEQQQKLAASEQARQLAEQQAAEAQQAAANREAEKQELLAQAAQARQQAYAAHQRTQTAAGATPLTYEEFMAHPHAQALQQQVNVLKEVHEGAEDELQQTRQKHAAEKTQMEADHAEKQRQAEADKHIAELKATEAHRRAMEAQAKFERERLARHQQAEQQRVAEAAHQEEERRRVAAEEEGRRKAEAVQHDIAAAHQQATQEAEMVRLHQEAAAKATRRQQTQVPALPAPPVTVPFEKPDTREPVIAQPSKKQAASSHRALPTQVRRDKPEFKQTKARNRMETDPDELPIFGRPKTSTPKHPLVDPYQVAPGTEEATPAPKKAKARVRNVPSQAPPTPVDPFKLSPEDQAALDARKAMLISQRHARAQKEAEEAARHSATTEKRPTLTREQQEKAFKGNAVAQKGTRRKTVKITPAAAAQAAAPIPHAVHVDRFVANIAPSKGVTEAKQIAAARVTDAKKVTTQVSRKLALPAPRVKQLEKSVVKHALSQEEKVAKKALVQHAEAKAVKLAAKSTGHRLLTAAEHHVPRPRLPAAAGKK